MIDFARRIRTSNSDAGGAKPAACSRHLEFDAPLRMFSNKNWAQLFRYDVPGSAGSRAAATATFPGGKQLVVPKEQRAIQIADLTLG